MRNFHNTKTEEAYDTDMPERERKGFRGDTPL